MHVIWEFLPSANHVFKQLKEVKNDKNDSQDKPIDNNANKSICYTLHIQK